MSNDYNLIDKHDVLMLNTVKDKVRPEEYFGDYHIHLLCYKGSAWFTMNGKRYEVHMHEFLIWQLGSDISDVSYSDDFNADFLCVSRGFLIKYNPERVWATKAFVFIKLHPVIRLNEVSYNLCQHDFNEFRFRLEGESHIFFNETVGGQLQMFLYDLWQIYSPMLQESQKATNSAADIFQRFLAMLANNAMTERRITYYADRLFVTSKYLSEVCRSCSGRPASEWIMGYSVQEMLRLLKDLELTLTEISDKMQFPNYPNFTKYCKTNLGVSPSEYRQQLEKRSK